jgi:hypothetical protein
VKSKILLQELCRFPGYKKRGKTMATRKDITLPNGSRMSFNYQPETNEKAEIIEGF